MSTVHRCKDCGLKSNETCEFYFLHNDIWFSIALQNEDLCIGCVEDRLGRTLTKDDFTSCYINSPMWGVKSSRLLNRLVTVT